LLLALEDVAKINRIDPRCFKLIISDFVEENIKSWLAHKQLKPFFEKGVLDCIQFDVQTEPSMMCLYGRKKLGLEDFAIPPMVIAHYVLDSLPIDVFRVKNGNLFAVHVGLGVDKSSDFSKDDIRRITFEKKMLRVQDQYYKNAFHNELIQSIAADIQTGCFDFPVAAFKLLDTLSEVIGSRYLFSCMDKGYVDHRCYQEGEFPPIFYHHNTFSFDFNFYAFNKYLEAKAGYSLWIASNRQLIKWQIASCDVQIEQTPEIDRFAQIKMEQSTPVDYLYNYAMAADMGFDWPFSALVSLLVQSDWDPVLFAQMGSQLVRKLPDTTLDEQSFLFSYFDTLEKNFFAARDSGDIYLVIGKLYHVLDAYEEAIAYFEKSKATFGEGYAVYFSMGKTYFASGDSSTALSMFGQAQKYKVTKQLKSWLEYFGKDSTYRKVKQKMAKKKTHKPKKKAKNKDSGQSSPIIPASRSMLTHQLLLALPCLSDVAFGFLKRIVAGVRR